MVRLCVSYESPKSEESDVWCEAQGKLVDPFFCIEQCKTYFLAYRLGHIHCGWTPQHGAWKPTEREEG